MDFDSIPDKLKSIKKSEKNFKFQRNLMPGRGELSKIKESICNIPIEAANICNILPRLEVSNGLVVVKLKRDLKYRDHVYFGTSSSTHYIPGACLFKIT